MAWTTPKTWATNEVVTSANMNTHLRDNMLFVGSPPVCVVSASGQSVSNNTLTAMSAPTETRDTDGMHSTSVNTSRITINTAGTYHFSACVAWDSNVTGIRQGIFFKNGSAVLSGFIITATQGASTVASFSQFLHLAVADYIEVFSLHNSGANLNTTLHDFSCSLVAVP